MSLASVVITSIMFAVVQYFESTNRTRIGNAKQRLSDNDLYQSPKLDRVDTTTASALRQEYDRLINPTSAEMGLEKGILYGILGVLALIHAANAVVFPESFDTDMRDAIEKTIGWASRWSWAPVIIMIGETGVRMLRSIRKVAKYEAEVEKLLGNLKIVESIN